MPRKESKDEVSSYLKAQAQGPAGGRADAHRRYDRVDRAEYRKRKVRSRLVICWNGGRQGILNVDSLEELDAIMDGFPFGPFSDVEVLPLANLDEALQRTKQAMLAMAGG